VLRAAELSITAGAQGITVHPRPDQRHIRTADVYALSDLLKDFPDVELNVEGNPFPEFLEIVRKAQPAQCTLVPDAPNAVTSDHGWNLEEEARRLESIIAELRSLGTRVSLFMDASGDQWKIARDLGAERIELYTQPYAEAFSRQDYEKVFAMYGAAAKAAQSASLGVNAGHDLNLHNLGKFCEISGVLEVSIGHALVADALEMGLSNAVRAYLTLLRSDFSQRVS